MKKNKIAFYEKLDSVYKLVRRDQILLYFDEEIDRTKPEYCCDCCGIERVFHQSTSEIKMLVEFSWKQDWLIYY